MMAEKFEIITLISIVVIDCLIIHRVNAAGSSTMAGFNDPQIILFSEAQKLEGNADLVELVNKLVATDIYNDYQEFKANVRMAVPIQHTFEICKDDEPDELASMQACNMASYKLYKAGVTVTDLERLNPEDLYTPYSKCYTSHVIDLGSIEQRLIYCPPTKIFTTKRGEPVLVERFLLGQGTHFMNSAFIYEMHHDAEQPGKFVSLARYIENVFVVDSMPVHGNTAWDSVRAGGIERHCKDTIPHYKKYRQTVQKSTKRIHNKLRHALCSLSPEEARYLCSIVAAFKSGHAGKCEQYTERSLYAKRADVSGYIPFKCKERKSGYYSNTTSNQKFFNETTLYCPYQLMTLDVDEEEQLWGCSGFFLSADAPDERNLFVHDYSLQSYRDKQFLEAIDVEMCISWSKIALLDKYQ